MSLQGDSTTDPRLNSFFDAPSEEKALEVFHRLWGSTLVSGVRSYLQKQPVSADLRSEMEVETCLRVCRSLLHRRTKADTGSAPPQQSPPSSTLISPVLITNIEGYAIAATRSLLYNHFLTQNPAWRRLQLRVVFHLKQDDKITRWKQDFQWMAGLTAWKGMAFRARSGRAKTFLNEDYAAFRQKGLRNQEPSESTLPDLMVSVFRWLDSPLWQNKLVGHLLKLYRQEANLPLSWEEISADGEQQEESVWNESMEDGVVTRQLFQEALCQDGLLDRLQRGVILLKMDAFTLTRGLGMTISRTADTLGVGLDALFGPNGEILLPMSDDQIAAILHIEATQTMTATERVSTYYRMTARRRLAGWLKTLEK